MVTGYIAAESCLLRPHWAKNVVNWCIECFSIFGIEDAIRNSENGWVSELPIQCSCQYHSGFEDAKFFQ